MNKVMIDLETMDTGPNAAIIAIGAVMFDYKSLGKTFYAVVDLESSMKEGGTVSGDTVMWWIKQSEAARSAIGADSYAIGDALNNLWNWLGQQCPINELEVWGNGAAFDNVVLASAYDRHGSFKGRPWKFYNDRCYRTVKAMHPGVPVDRVGTAHNALDDAITQAAHLIKITQAKPPVLDKIEPPTVEEVAKALEKLADARLEPQYTLARIEALDMLKRVFK